MIEKKSTLDRGGRRKAKTRAKLLQASKKLLSVRGLDKVSIKDITDEADVGLGTFYSHFDSKNKLLRAIADDYLKRYNLELDKIIEGLSDPAEIVCVSYKFTLAQALDKFAFSILQQLPGDYLRNRISERASADIEIGMKTGRLKTDNINAFMSFASSMLLGVMDHYARDILSQEDAEHTAVYYMRLLGVDEDEAIALVAKPMPNQKIN